MKHELYEAMNAMEERLNGRSDDIDDTVNERVNSLCRTTRQLKYDIRAIQYQGQPSESIDTVTTRSTDITPTETTDAHVVASIDTESLADRDQLIHDKIDAIHNELRELS